jgi:hypothetical protein
MRVKPFVDRRDPPDLLWEGGGRGSGAGLGRTRGGRREDAAWSQAVVVLQRSVAWWVFWVACLWAPSVVAEPSADVGEPSAEPEGSAGAGDEVPFGTELADDWSGADVEAWLRSQGLGGGESSTGEVSFSAGGFADVLFHVAEHEGHPHGEFHVGQLVFHGLADLTRGFFAFMEVSINTEPFWETRVERLSLSWELNDHLRLSVGRHHLPVTWWNSTFHHGMWLQTTARRPLVVGFNDAFVPNHATGLVAEGKVPWLGAYGLRYHLGVSGGSDDHVHAQKSGYGHGGDEAPRLAYSGGLFVEPPSLPRLRTGAVVFVDPRRVREGREVEEWMMGAHVAYTGESPELVAEVVAVYHDASGLGDGDVGGQFLHWTYYVQGAWRLGGRASAWKPYVRYERLLLDDAQDPTLASASEAEVMLGGIRWDVTPWLALRLEGSRRRVGGQAARFDGLLQASAAW